MNNLDRVLLGKPIRVPKCVTCYKLHSKWEIAESAEKILELEAKLITHEKIHDKEAVS
jgi:hypothetical protein